jgi:tripartite-type tricarboxylate transporter receptor subunit TctC
MNNRVAVVAAIPLFAGAQVGISSKPVRVIVPFTAGSPAEIPARPRAEAWNTWASSS